MPDLTYRAVIATCRGLFRLLGLRIEVSGAEHLPVQGAAVVAANHNSYADDDAVARSAARSTRR